MEILQQAPLGKKIAMPAAYDPTLLFPIPRSLARAALGLDIEPPFVGSDTWTAFELGWRNVKGKPEVGIASFTIPCSTPNMIESKSLKLYLNSLNDERFASADAVAARIHTDLLPVLWGDTPASAPMVIDIRALSSWTEVSISELEGDSLDDADIEWDGTPFSIDNLRIDRTRPLVTETLRSDLVRALCRVTAQPDWGSVQISYRGHALPREDLLRYLVSFRHQQEFHEPLAERIFMDLWRHAQPAELSVYLRFVRRGGLDINPFRASVPQEAPQWMRLARQ